MTTSEWFEALGVERLCQQLTLELREKLAAHGVADPENYQVEYDSRQHGKTARSPQPGTIHD